jgi:hypothetical protein
MINTNVFPDFTFRYRHNVPDNVTLLRRQVTHECDAFWQARYVKSVFIVHVGGTRCVTSSTDHYMNIHARITLSIEFIRTCIFLF